MSRPSDDKLREIVARFPTTREEDWKYTDLSRARDIADRWLEEQPASAAPPSPDGTAAITDTIDAAWLVIADGELRTSQLPDGVTVGTVDDIPLGDSALAEFNAALVGDGIRIRITGDVGTPIGLLMIDGAERTSVSQAYVEIDFDDGASAELIEYHVSRGQADQYANTFVTFGIGEAASVSHVRIQDRGRQHVQTSETRVRVGKDARFSSASFDLGGGLVRNDIDIDIAHPGADVSFDGLYLAGDGQHIDNHTRVDHRVGPATSRQEYRGILNGRCRCVWNGKAIVHEGADGTDADQANHNLLLSEHAEIDAKPELEIYTDDVKCSHGTTVGQLDETALFYLRSRGLDRNAAIQVLTHAFAAGLVTRVPVPAAREVVSSLIEKRLEDLAVTVEDETS
ncbi:MAG: Fe-S cluster assembly protein SufD [Woeseiaceae bacterium]|nr:Fe-S cluster assembly protein SufD [Woeseiaceae bacterium]